MNQFGVTSPCAKIAAHFNVPQGFVDASMEFKLVEHGIRARNNWPTHCFHYWPRPVEKVIDHDTVINIHVALDLVCKDILAAAGK